MKKTQPKQAFTLIELLTVIAIIGILASILIPTVGRVRESARRSVDASNIRQIGQACLIYANDHREALPPKNLDPQTGLPTPGGGDSTTVIAFAGALAHGGGINDGNIWRSSSDSAGSVQYNGAPILEATGTPRNIRKGAGDFGTLDAISFVVVSGLRTSMPSTTPIALTRGLNPSAGEWLTQRNLSVYGSDGGHIVFMGGNVSFYKNTKGDDNKGIFIKASDGQRTHNVLESISSGSANFHALPVGPIQQKTPSTG